MISSMIISDIVIMVIGSIITLNGNIIVVMMISNSFSLISSLELALSADPLVRRV